MDANDSVLAVELRVNLLTPDRGDAAVLSLGAPLNLCLTLSPKRQGVIADYDNIALS
jgi:hypothetical protein